MISLLYTALLSVHAGQLHSFPLPQPYRLSIATTKAHDLSSETRDIILNRYSSSKSLERLENGRAIQRPLPNPCFCRVSNQHRGLEVSEPWNVKRAILGGRSFIVA